MPRTPERPPLSLVSGETTSIPPPRKLGPHGTHLWNAIQREFAIADAAGIELLAQACQALDRAEGLAAAIAGDGEVIYSRTGVPRTHPACRDELGARAFCVKTLERLGVTLENVPATGRPGKSFGWSPE
jgi:hypothetical protein